MKIIKSTGSFRTTNIQLQDDENKSLEINCNSKGDLHWIIKTTDNPVSDYETFSITKKDYDLYAIFAELYDDISNSRVYIPRTPEELKGEIVLSELDEATRDMIEYKLLEDTMLCDELNADLKDSKCHQQLYQEGAVVLRSDEEPGNIGNVVRITKQEDGILLEFIRQTQNTEEKTTVDHHRISICIRGFGSMYTPFDQIFMHHFKMLQQYEPLPTHQIHLEEYMYLQKLKTSKN